MPPTQGEDWRASNNPAVLELQDEIVLQQGILESLQAPDDIDDRDEAIREVRQEIKTLKRRLKALVQAKQTDNTHPEEEISPESRRKLEDAGDIDAANKVPNEVVNSASEPSSSKTQSTKDTEGSTSSSTMSSYTSTPDAFPDQQHMTSPSQLALHTRKRTHGTHLGDMNLLTDANKSRRTSPSSFPGHSRGVTPISSSEDEDFFRFDQTFFQSAAREMEARAQQEKADAEYARQLQFGIDDYSNLTPASAQPMTAFPSYSHSAATASQPLQAVQQSLPWQDSQAGPASFSSNMSATEPPNTSPAHSQSTVPPNQSSLFTRRRLPWQEPQPESSSSSSLSVNRFFSQNRPAVSPQKVKKELKSEKIMSSSLSALPVFNKTSEVGVPLGVKQERSSHSMSFNTNYDDEDSDIEQISASAFYARQQPFSAIKTETANPWIKNEGSSMGQAADLRNIGDFATSSQRYLPATGNVYSSASASMYSVPGAYPVDSKHPLFDYGMSNQLCEDYFDLTSESEQEDIRFYIQRDHYGGHNGGLYARGMREDHDTKEQINSLLANIRPDEDLPKENREGTPDGLKYPLYEHQKVALTWLRNQEESVHKGGILADDMGLGKTISALALMLSRPSDDLTRKTTLIVGPVALVRQWEREIQTKIKFQHRLSTLLIHGQTKARGKGMSWQDIQVYDVVLTTYGTLAAELRRMEKYIATRNIRPELLDHVAMSKLFPLLSPKSRFHRVILDEAQCIKNKNTATAKACFRLLSTYRLCLTGTPMMNNIGELYSLILFLGIKPYNEWTRFRTDFGALLTNNRRDHDKDRAMQRLQVLLKSILLRRVKSSLIDGKPIITLPPKIEEVQHVVFDEDEKAFYQALENKTQLQFNKYVKKGTVGKNYSNILVLLLRLRQACCHPHLIQDFEQAPGEMEGDAKQLIELAKTLNEDVIARILAAEGNFDCPICYDGVPNPAILIPCGHDCCSECLAKIQDQAALDNVARGDDGRPVSHCSICRNPIDASKVIDYATFKKVHIKDLPEEEIETASEHSDSGSQSDMSSDSDSGSDDTEDDVDSDGDLRDFIVPDDVEDPDDEDDAESAQKKPTAKKKGKGKIQEKKSSKGKKVKRGKKKEKKKRKAHRSIAMLKTDANKSIEGRRRYMRYLRKHWEPSAKVTKCFELLEQFQEENEKTIVFSQFVSLLDLIQVPIEDKRWRFERYDGSMNAEARHDAITRFTDSPNCKIMLISLKAGNAGLNLVAASRVIILDPFWNPYIEMQAIDRAYRIGQQKSVQVHRILIEGTVEDRIITLQEQKRKIVEAALDEEGHKSLGRLGVEQLRFLFFGGSH